jgi:hypothetical protein
MDTPETVIMEIQIAEFRIQNAERRAQDPERELHSRAADLGLVMRC